MLAFIWRGRKAIHCQKSNFTLSNKAKELSPINKQCYTARFLDLDHSLNRKRERFKGFEVEPRSNSDDVIINLIIILNIYKNIKLIEK